MLLVWYGIGMIRHCLRFHNFYEVFVWSHQDSTSFVRLHHIYVRSFFLVAPRVDIIFAVPSFLRTYGVFFLSPQDSTSSVRFHHFYGRREFFFYRTKSRRHLCGSIICTEFFLSPQDSMSFVRFHNFYGVFFWSHRDSTSFVRFHNFTEFLSLSHQD